MSRASKMKKFIRAVIVAGLLVNPGCNDGGNGKTNPGVSGSLWNSTSGSGSGGSGGLLWNDPNSAPTGPGGAGGDLTFGQADPMLFPSTNPDAPHPVSIATAQNTTEEATIEGSASAYNATLVNLNNGGGGIAGVGGFGGVGGNQRPPFYSGNQLLQAVARADCKHRTIHPTFDEPGIVGGNYLDWRLQKAGVNSLMQNSAEFPVQAATAAAAWNAMSAGAQAWIQGITQSGWAGGGFWSANGQTWYNLVMIELPTGQIP